MKLLHYQWDPISDLIAEGGFAEVFKAEDLNTPDRYVALKIYKEAVSRGTIGNTGNKKYSLEQEFRKVHHLSHTNIISYYGLDYIEHTDAMGRTVSYPVLIMEYAGEGTLADRIKKGMSEASVKKIGIEIGQALHYLHRQGIVHRDLKPGNILFAKDNRGNLVVKVTDFGISQDVLSDKTIENSFTEGIGTPHYMAPEQFYKKKYGLDGEIGICTDIWAMGVMLYKMLTGKMPFGEGTKEYELVREEIVGQTPDFSQIPAFYEPIIRKCLEKNAVDRFENMDQVLSLLRQDEADKTVDISALSGVQSSTTKKKTSPWKFLVAIILLAGISFGGYRFYNFQQKNSLLSAAQLSFKKDNFKDAYENYLKASDYGAGEADYYLSYMNIYGVGALVDYKKGKEHAEKAVENDYKMAGFLLGDMYLKGEGVPIDTTRALRHYKNALPHIQKLAEENNAEALSTLGILYYSGLAVDKDLEKSFVYTEKAAKQNHLASLVNLGRLYQYADIAGADCGKALEWYEKGVKRNDKRALFSLGNLYYRGCGSIKKDHIKALKFFKLAANQGSLSAIIRIGYMYFTGTESVAKDLDEALLWYNKAAEKNLTDAYGPLGQIYEERKKYKKAEEWYKKSAENNSNYGAYYLGSLYYNGYLGKQDLEKAKKYYLQSSEGGNAAAMAMLGVIFYGKEHMDYEKAYRYFKQADSLGNTFASLYLGYMLEFGNGREIDIPSAITYYKKAANSRLKEAEYAMGRMYTKKYLKQDYVGQDKYWFTRAAKQGYPRANYYLGDIAYTKKDYKEAKFQFEKAVGLEAELMQDQRGRAYNLLGYIYENGLGGATKNVFTAARYYGYSAKNNHDLGAFNLGLCFYYGRGKFINKATAKTYFQQSCSLGFEKACSFLKDHQF